MAFASQFKCLTRHLHLNAGFWFETLTPLHFSILPAVECGPLVMPKNASSYGELTTYPNKVHFQCDEGFVLKGSSVRVCLANGSWSGNDTSCKGVSSPVLALSLPRNATLLGAL